MSANETVTATPSAGAALPSLPALDNTFGALYLGTCFGLILYGLTVHQVYRYFRLYPTDTVFHKTYVLFALAIETLHSICTMHVVYHYLVTNYFNPLALGNDVWSLRTLTWVSGLAIVLSQGFYARRVFRLSEGWWFKIVIVLVVLLIITEIAFIIAATTEGFLLATLAEYQKFAWMVSVVYGVTVSCDIILTGSLTWVLLKKRTGFKNTDSLIAVIVLYSINTGLMTGVFGLLVFIFALVMPNNLVYIGISIFGTKLYINSVLAVLNSRKSLNNRNLNGFELNSFDTSGMPSSSATRSRNTTHLASALRVGVSKTTATHVDIQMKPHTHLNRSAEDGLGDENEMPMQEYK